MAGAVGAGAASAERVVLGIHERGCAAHLARTPTITRYYLQMSLTETKEDWSDEHVWHELRTRLAVPDSPVAEGPLVEKRLRGMHNCLWPRPRRGGEIAVESGAISRCGRLGGVE
ncbi:hypothetical protein AB0F91_05355 [Amycolatopsis sp. NPDC023774]|uniref:hypothetical protein n=1 Tax=Amycolatopsis sp. NPDC023774 TaxID=3155015 RepID=UPI0033FAD155